MPPWLGPNANGLCECGCGGKTTVPDRTCARRGIFKGQPRRFIHGHHSRSSLSLRERLDRWTYPEPNSGCHLYVGDSTKAGYGVIAANGTRIYAHRLAWVLAGRAIPAGLHVLHKCDLPCCVNPDHLFLGTHADNMRDKEAKGRGGQRKGRQGLPYGVQQKGERFSARSFGSYLGVFDTAAEAASAAADRRAAILGRRAER